MTQLTDTVPEEFADQVKQALENLYDFPALQRHPFASKLNDDNPNNRDSPAHHLRRLIIEAIERLNPGTSAGVRSGTKRIYNLLHLHYVGSMTLQEVALELGISVRQAYRDLKKGQDSVSSVLWFKFGQDDDTPSTEATMNELSSMQSEMTRIGGAIEWVDLQPLFESILGSLRPLAEQKDVLIENHLPDQSRISTNPTIARPVLMTLLSQVIQQSPQAITLDTEETERHLVLHITFQHALSQSLLTPVVEQLLEQLSWELQQDSSSARVLMKRFDASVLLIDDNTGLVDLMKRYLGDESFQVMTAYSGVDGLKLAQEAQPDVIVMDIMMPEMDGWELLQRLRTIPDTRHIPIVVCSVINDPQLATSLGADKFVAKPIDKDKLLQAIAELNL